jgi:hypothetical protein
LSIGIVATAFNAASADIDSIGISECRYASDED